MRNVLLMLRDDLRIHRRHFTVSPYMLLVIGIAVCACGGSVQSVRITAEDFRFVPEVLRVKSSRPLVISIYNGGREEHEFDSPVLMYNNQSVSGRFSGSSVGSGGSGGIVLRAGESFRFVMSPPAGTYLYTCRRKGHANMTGTLIVEES
ncbi:hypothetical protein [Nitrospira sp. KM1]|uniref:hypothetical protein n=1 Tax=Nitrospira sp. KM1 TaxID=1936990 RepID=UPI00156649B7|nr:hypothetical protein [Nitrospira sp. KM1]